jgi:hypothetical protein
MCIRDSTKAAHYLCKKLLETPHFKGVDYPFFNEFVLNTDLTEEEIKERLLKIDVIPPLKKKFTTKKSTLVATR